MNKPSLVSKKRNHYDNILILGPDKNPISTIDKRRLNFYKKHNLVNRVTDIDGYDSVYTLKFEPNIDKEIKYVNYMPIENRCVISGETENLTLHHVVPYCIRRYLPFKYKDKSKEWCVLLTDNNHNDVEVEVLKLYQNDRTNYYLENYDFSLNKKYEVLKMYNNGYWDRIPATKQIKLMLQAHIYDLEELEDLSTHNIQKEIDESKGRVYKDWVKCFIKRHGGVRSMYDMFGNHFRETFKPKYLPKGFLEWHFD